MTNHTKNTPQMGNHGGASMSRYIIETPNQRWYVTSYDGKYPLYLTNDHPKRASHVFSDLAVAKEAITLFWNMRGGAKLKIYQLAGDGKRVEIKS